MDFPMKYCTEVTPTFLSAVFVTLSLSVLSYALYLFWNPSVPEKPLDKSQEESSRELKMQRSMSEDSVEIPPRFLHFHKLVGALNAEILPNWCKHLRIDWNDVIADILEWMHQENHPNVHDFETCMSIILYKNEQKSQEDVIDDETYIQASIWMNVALQLWDMEPSLVMPQAWFVVSEVNENVTAEESGEKANEDTVEQSDEDEKSKEPVDNKSQE